MLGRRSSKPKRVVRTPEDRMTLIEHLAELRTRIIKIALTLAVATTVVFFLFEPIQRWFAGPYKDLCKMKKNQLKCPTVGTFIVTDPLEGFGVRLKVAGYGGLIIALPVVLWQLWQFIVPGLHKNEKKYALSFVGTGVPLFLGGAYFAYRVLPTTAQVLIGFTPKDVNNLLPLDDLLDLVTRMVLVFGLSFELPLLLIMLNLTGALTGKRMLGWWRAMILGITVFAAVATPSTDPLTMLALAGPIWVLYFGAVVFSLLNDRRKRRREAEGPDDDEASDLDLTPEDIGDIETVSAGRAALPEQASGTGSDRVNGYDDVT